MLCYWLLYFKFTNRMYISCAIRLRYLPSHSVFVQALNCKLLFVHNRLVTSNINSKTYSAINTNYLVLIFSSLLVLYYLQLVMDQLIIFILNSEWSERSISFIIRLIFSSVCLKQFFFHRRLNLKIIDS